MAQTMATDKARLSLYMDRQIKEKAEKLAEARRRSLSNLIETVMLKEIEKAEKAGEIK